MRPIVLILFLIPVLAFAQTRVSMATDVTVLRNFSPQQHFTVFGQTIMGNFHFSRKETAYAQLAYYSPAKFTNTFVATAKSPATNPQQMAFKVAGRYRFREVSLGWKHYFHNSFDEEVRYSLYYTAGFGLMFSRTDNEVISADTVRYSYPPPYGGKGTFFRLTFDLAAGGEYPVGGNFFAYGELRTWIPTTSTPNVLIHNNKNLPMPAIVRVGLRILFGY